jgi:hypothetical protein
MARLSAGPRNDHGPYAAPSRPRDLPERYDASLLIDANCEAGRGARVAIYCGDERVTDRELLDPACAMARAHGARPAPAMQELTDAVPAVYRVR